MNKLWVFVGGCVTGALGLLAAAALSDGPTSVLSGVDDEACDSPPEDGQEEGRHFAAEADETVQARST
jgi:hypothetical protein